MVEECEEFACRRFDRRVRCSGDSPARGQLNEVDAWITARTSCEEPSYRRVRRGVIRYAELPIVVDLAMHGVDCSLEESRWGVVDRHDNADLRPIRQRFRAFIDSRQLAVRQ